MPPHPRRWRLNVRACIILGVVLVLAIAGLFALSLIQGWNGRSSLLQQARLQFEAEPPNYQLAMIYLNEYLEARPDDPEALDMKAQILSNTATSAAHLFTAISLEDRSLRLLKPDDPEGPARRRRLVQMYLKMGQFVPLENLQLQTAEAVARELARQSDDAESQRLLAQILQKKAAAGDPEALKEAVAAYEKARARDPGNVEGSVLLAQLYYDQIQPPEPARATQVLDDLLKANPSVETRLARHHYFAAVAEDASEAKPRARLKTQASQELIAALKKAPQDVPTLLAAAEFAMQQGDLAEARRHLERIPAEKRDSLQVKRVEGQLAMYQNHYDEAIESWRQGLILTNGNDTELTFHLANVLLTLGRVDEADPLVEQFRRLTGGDPDNGPLLFLEGIRYLRLNQPEKALETLGRARFKVASLLQAQVHLAMGQAYEATRNELGAVEQYTEASKIAPKWPTPRLALIRLVQDRDPARADLELDRALAAQPDEPALLLMQARDEFKQQLALPAEKRSWDGLRAQVERIKEIAPADPNLVLLQADLLNVTGEFDKVPPLLEQAVRHDPSKVEIWTAWASSLQRLGRRDEALKVLREATSPDAVGDDATLRIAIARLLTTMGHGQEARAMLVQGDQALRPDQRPLVWAELGAMHLQRRELDQARAAYAHWAELAPNDPQPRLILLDLALTQKDQKAADQQIEALKKTGGPGSVYYLVARAQELLRDPPPGRPESPDDRAQRLDQAEELIKQIQIKAPQQRYAYLLEGMLQERRDAPEQAIMAYERSLDYEGGQLAVERLAVLYARLNRLADLERLRRRAGAAVGTALAQRSIVELINSGKREAAEKLARQLAQGDPDSLDTRVWEARVLNTLGKPEQAEQTLRDLIASQPESLGPWVALLYFQVGLGRNEEALKTIDQLKASVTKVERPELIWAQCYRIVQANDRAAEAFEQALARWPDDNAVAQAAINFYESVGPVDRAEELAKAVVDRDPSQRWAVRTLAVLMATRGARDPDLWQKAWDMIKDPPSDGDLAEDRLARAMVLIRCPDLKRHAEAIPLLEGLVADLPADRLAARTARNQLLNLYNQQGRPEKFRELLAQDAAGGTNPTAIAVYGETLLNDGKIEEAARQLDRLAAVAPEALVTAKLRALVLRAQAHPDQAAESLEQFFDKHQNDNDAETNGREILAMLGGTPGALAVLADQTAVAERLGRRVAERWPATSWMLARILLRQDRPEETLQACQTAVNAAGGLDARQACEIAMSLGLAPDASDAVKNAAATILDAALKREPEALEFLVMTAFLRHAQGRYQEEVDLYRQARAQNPANVLFLNNMAWTLSEELSQPKEALEVINGLLDRTNDPQFLDTRAQILVRLDRPGEAVEDMSKVVQALPDKPAYHYHLARAYYKAGKMDEFRKERDLAKQNGLKAADLEPSERAEMEQLMAL